MSMNTDITFNKSIIFLFSNHNIPHVLDCDVVCVVYLFAINKIGFKIKLQ